jgi:hypothetical protein
MLEIILTQVFIFTAFWLDAHRDAWPASSHFHTYKVFSLGFFIGAGFTAPNLWVMSAGILWGSILWDLVFRWRRYGSALAESPFFLTIPGYEFRLLDNLGGEKLLSWALIRIILGIIAMVLR